MNSLEIAIGFLIVVVLLFDIFQAVLVPRFTPASLRFAPLLIGRIAWPYCRKIAALIRYEPVLDFCLGAFAPMAFVLIFVTWLISMTLAFGLIIHGLGTEFRPQIHDYPTAAYMAGTAITTLGFGDIVAISPLGRSILLMGAGTGITVVAIGVAFLFSMQQSVHSREVLVHSFQSRVGEKPSAVKLLLNYADRGITDLLAAELTQWEVWASEVLTSHRAFPLLCYFRSGHLCSSWLTVMGVMLDTANLLSTVVDDNRFGHAGFLIQLGSKFVNFLREYLRLQPISTPLSREEFHSVYVLLGSRGYRLHEEENSWERFIMVREVYLPSLNALTHNFVGQSPAWLTAEDISMLDDKSKFKSKRHLAVEKSG